MRKAVEQQVPSRRFSGAVLNSNSAMNEYKQVCYSGNTYNLKMPYLLAYWPAVIIKSIQVMQWW